MQASPLYGVVWLLLFQLAGEVTARCLSLPVPGPVLGLFLLFVTLIIRGGVPEHVRSASSGLLEHLMLLLIPATAGIMVHFGRLAEEWLAIVSAAVGGAAATIAVTASVLRLLLGVRKDADR